MIARARCSTATESEHDWVNAAASLLFQRRPPPALRRPAQLVGGPITLVELQRDDIHRAVPAGGAQANRGSVLTAGNDLDEGVEVGRGLAIDFDDAASRPQLIARGR